MINKDLILSIICIVYIMGDPDTIESNTETPPTDELKLTENYSDSSNHGSVTKNGDYHIENTDSDSESSSDEEYNDTIGGAFGSGKGDTKIKLDIELGDIVSLCAPDNPELNGNTFFVEYITDTRILLIDVLTLREVRLGFNKHRQLIDKTIIGWNLLSREESKGYCALYGFTVKKWVSIYFDGDVPQIITGEITNVEEDMIEVMPLDKFEPIYIDFAYQGIPEDLNISKIELREEPVAPKQYKTRGDDSGEKAVGEIDEANIEYLANGEAILVIPEDAVPEAIVIDDYDELAEEEFTLFMEIPENEKRYGIDIQITEMLESLLEAIPIFKRTPHVLQNIHNLIERYKQLRKESFVFDSNGFVEKKKPKIGKLLVETVKQLNTKLSWILPVIEMKKKIYHTHKNPIVDDAPPDIQPLLLDENIRYQEETHENTIVGEGRTLYDEYLIQNTEFQRPYITASSVANTAVMCNQEMLVSNNDVSLKTHVVKPGMLEDEEETFLSNFSFFVQTTLASTKYVSSIVSKNGKNEVLYKHTPCDKVNVHSVVILPESATHYSRVYLPTTDILTRCELSLTPFYLFNILKKKHFSVSTIDDETKDVNLFENFKQGQIIQYKGKKMNYSDVLSKIMPSNETVLRSALNQIVDKISVFELIRLTEPFLIYKENIEHSVYLVIRDLLKQKMNNHVKAVHANKNIYKKLLGAKGLLEENAVATTKIQSLLKSEDSNITAEFIETFKKTYMPDEAAANVSSSEMLYRISKMDGGQMYFTMMSYALFYLITPDKLAKGVPPPPSVANEEFAVDCARQVIAKKYSSLREMQKDNGVAVYFDKEMDETPYDVYKIYKNERTKYTEKDFYEYLKTSLIQIHNCPPSQAKEMAETLMAGKKAVKAGEYAVLMETPNLFKHLNQEKWTDKEKAEINLENKIKTKYTYYKRSKTGEWQLDTSIEDPEGKLLNRFCERIQSCKKTPYIQTCEMKKRVEEVLYVSLGEKMADMKTTMKFLNNKNTINDVLQDIALNSKYDLGKNVAKDANTAISPFTTIRQYILAEADFVKKQQYIIRFYTKFCRQADYKEDKQWGYCRETNVKLFPTSLFELAIAFANNKYQQRLDELVFHIGELSTDGDSVVDKHTGYVLKRVDDSAEEGYDESGSKITTNSIIEKDAVDVVLKEMEKGKEKVFKTETATKVYKIFSVLKMRTGIKDEDEDIENFVMKHSMHFLCNSAKLPTECVFNEKVFLSQREFDDAEKAKALKKLNYKKQNYNSYMNKNIIATTVSMFLIAIQTSIPGIKPRKTYPNCSYSYGGFPMTSDNDLSGITFLSCVVKSFVKEGVLARPQKELWESIKYSTVEDLTKNMRDVLNTLIVDVDTRYNYLVELYLKKKEYAQLEMTRRLVDYGQVKKWSLFLPPLVPFTIVKSIKPLEPTFDTELKKMIVHRNRGQNAMLDVYKSKMKQMSYGVVERIQKIIKAIVNPNLIHSALIQNACCNENNITHPMKYFIDKDKEILTYIVSINQYSHKYNELYFVKPKLLHFYEKSGKATVARETATQQNHLLFNKEAMYAAYIQYCNYDNDLPTEEDLKDLCNPKPKEYERTATLREKIDLLEKNKIIYNEPLQIKRLMNKIHKRNVVSMFIKPEISIVDRFVEFLNKETRLDKPFASLLLTIFEKCKTSGKIQVVETDNIENVELINLIEYLDDEIQRKYAKTMDFLKQNKTQNMRQFKEDVFFKEIVKNKKLVGNTEDTNEKNHQFVKNVVKQMTSVFPRLIVSTTKPFLPEDKKTLTHWNFSGSHDKKLNGQRYNFYSGLNPFFDERDELLHSYLNGILDQLSFYNELIRLLPMFKEIEIGGKKCYNALNTTSVDLILKYVWFSVLEKYIDLTEDPELIREQRNKLATAGQDGDNDPTSFTDTAFIVSATVDETDLIDVYDDIQPTMGRNETLLFKSKIADLLKAFLIMQEETQKTVDFDYNTVKAESFKISEREKKDVIEKIGRFNKYDQDVDKLQRKLKLGSYYVDPKFYNNPDFFENNNPAGAADDEEDGIVPIMNGEEGEPEDVGNPQYDLDDMDEDANGETRLDQDDTE